MTGNVLLRQEVETSPLSGGDGLMMTSPWPDRRIVVDLHGSCDARFEPVRDAFERNFTELGDVGASFAMTLEGEFVVDLWAGHRNAARTEPWLADTIVNVYSCTKTMTANDRPLI